MKNGGRIDLHHHYTSPEWFAFLTEHHEKSYPFPGLRTLSKWSAAAGIEAMDAGGVQTAVLSTTTPGVWFGDVAEARRMARNMNDFGAEIVRAYPGRYGLFGVLPLPDIDASLNELVYVLDTLKADGIGVLSSYGTKWLGDPSFEPVWAELNRRKAVVFSHATAPACCRGFVMPSIDKTAKSDAAAQTDEETTIELNTDTARTIVSLIESGTAGRYPNVRFIFSHAGGTIPALAGRYLKAQATAKALAAPAPPDSRLDHLRRFYYDTAGSANPVQLQAMKMIVSPSQLVFGTDFPWGTPAAIAAGLAGCGFSDAELAGIDRDNALRLLPQFA
jgi:predicted TIM-barrel fold metal-dependent hydrolase